MSHYYKNDSKLASNEKSYDVQILGTSFRFFTDAGVFSKNYIDYGTLTLLENLKIPKSAQVIVDMGCGYGPIGLYLAKTNPDKSVYLGDVNQRALALAQKNKELNAIDNATIIETNLFLSIPVSSDVVITNPPIRAGKTVIFDLYDQAYHNLQDGGHFYCVIQKKQGAPSTVKKLEELFGNCEVFIKKKGYWLLFAEKTKK